MFSRVFVGVADFERAMAFHEPVMAALGIAQRFVDRARRVTGKPAASDPHVSGGTHRVLRNARSSSCAAQLRPRGAFRHP